MAESKIRPANSHPSLADRVLCCYTAKQIYNLTAVSVIQPNKCKNSLNYIICPVAVVCAAQNTQIERISQAREQYSCVPSLADEILSTSNTTQLHDGSSQCCSVSCAAVLQDEACSDSISASAGEELQHQRSGENVLTNKQAGNPGTGPDWD